jgi:uncharacterized protein (TIGR03083 family)
MDIDRHIAAVEEAGSLLADAAGRVPLSARVPSCPDWDVRELVRHQGGVHRWATSIVGTPRTEYWDVGLDEVVGEWPSDHELLAWFRAGCGALVAALTAAPHDLECWTFLAAPSPKAMWARRQAHETTIHRVDAELSAGGPLSPIGAELAADGVDELVSCFITRPGSRLRADPPRTLGLRPTDIDDGWVVTIGPNGTETRRDPSAGADCTVTGRAADLYFSLWSRTDPTTLDVSGDTTVLKRFFDIVHVRWS